MRCSSRPLPSVIVLGLLSAISVTAANLPTALAEDDLPVVDDQLGVNERREAAFEKLDTDGNRKLSEQEFVQTGEPNGTAGPPTRRDLRRRDFLLFDVNSDRSISRTEFTAMPGIGSSAQRARSPIRLMGCCSRRSMRWTRLMTIGIYVRTRR